jgi:hypothetical protein
MERLADLGFSKGVITETIVTTYNWGGLPNAAPMGAIMENEQRILVRPYTSSLTYRNLQSKKCAVVNITSNPEVFYKTAFKEANPEGKVPKEWFEKAETVDAPQLQIADAIIEISVEAIVPISSERTEAVGIVKLIKARKLLPQVYCRALFVTVEAIIHATRVKVFLAGDENEKKQALKLLETIGICRDVVHHVAPNSRYSEIMADLNRMLDSWRVKSESLR